ncbi:developmental regulator VelB [Colletotrichum truncatum]|uniref:Developmental regulator VelB n=1 Tax=Colletotrichum truncatum TaxID=5467 RepID=A0ACC3Z5K9_COLTU|nr:developmental regulator VelB [Colletotrichum truncatum]KAF6795250.1 developmental regulator VelB [Colletotrichum truncatum]
MNYDQQHQAAGGYHHMAPNPYGHQLPPPSQHHPSAPQHHPHPPSQMPQLPPMSYPPPAPLPSNMAGNGIPPQHLPSAPGAPGAAAPPAQKTGPLPEISKTDDQGRQYRLDVVQQPQRARMCGFGDKDRRPITPPPCIRVVVFDPVTKQEIHVNEVDHAHFIINVDLWSEDGQQEVNLVRHSSTTASISTTIPHSFTGLRDDIQPIQPYAQIMPSYGAPSMGYGQQQPPAPGQPPMVPGYTGYQRELLDHCQFVYMAEWLTTRQAPPTGYQSTNAAFAPPTQYYPQHASATVPSQADMAYGHRQSMSMASSQPQGMFTRNLIGSLASSAFRLNDTNDNVGIWFIMQDLSVRTEGHFRLRFSFVSVAKRPGQPSAQGSMVNMGKSPVLAQCFSDVFQVYSAKKFPGVCESTALSKCFAQQGIKIPIRKDGPSDSKKGNDDEEDF